MSWLKNFLNVPDDKRDGAVCEIRLGLPGDCKSLDQTLEAVLPHLLAGEEVWCCYWLNWNQPNYHYFQPRDFDAIKDLRNAVVVFDEVAQMWEPRDWENESGEVRKFFQLHRHHHIDIYANTQDVSLVAKTVGIIGSNWIKMVKTKRHWLADWFIYQVIGMEPRILCQKKYMTFQEVKKESLGWELGEVIEERGDMITQVYTLSSIIRSDLDKYKVEIVHRYCPKCCSRQGEMILKEDTDKVCQWDKKYGYRLKEKEYCPKHHDILLEIKESGLYDTDYEPEVLEKEYTLVKMKSCGQCGHKSYLR